MAYKEFNYIYQICDPKSYPNNHGYNNKEAHNHAIDVARLRETYTPDEFVLNAMKLYTQLRHSVANELRNELLLTLNNSTKIVRRLRELIDKTLAKSNLTNEDVMLLIESQNKLISMAATLPKQITTLQNAEKIIDVEEEEESAFFSLYPNSIFSSASLK